MFDHITHVLCMCTSNMYYTNHSPSAAYPGSPSKHRIHCWKPWSYCCLISYSNTVVSFEYFSVLCNYRMNVFMLYHYFKNMESVIDCDPSAWFSAYTYHQLHVCLILLLFSFSPHGSRPTHRELANLFPERKSFKSGYLGL